MSSVGELEDHQFDALLRNGGFHEILSIGAAVFGEDVKYSIIKFLCSRKAASVREIARNVGMSHKNLLKYLDFLERRGVVSVVYSGPNIRLYSLSERASILARLLRWSTSCTRSLNPPFAPTTSTEYTLSQKGH